MVYNLYRVTFTISSRSFRVVSESADKAVDRVLEFIHSTKIPSAGDYMRETLEGVTTLITGVII